jgi:hypothetical protein
MAYAALIDLQIRYGEAEILQLSDRDSDGHASAAISPDIGYGVTTRPIKSASDTKMRLQI